MVVVGVEGVLRNRGCCSYKKEREVVTSEGPIFHNCVLEVQDGDSCHFGS